MLALIHTNIPYAQVSQVSFNKHLPLSAGNQELKAESHGFASNNILRDQQLNTFTRQTEKRQAL